MKSYRRARERYQQHLDEEKKKKDKEEKSEELEKVENELKALGDEATNLESTIKEMNTEYFKLILKAEEKNNMLLVVQGNALKRKSEEKEGHLGQLKKRMLELQEKKQTMH